MGLYEDWKSLAEKKRDQAEYNSFWEDYFEKEKKNYEYLLENHKEVVSGKLGELSGKFGMDPIVFTGFLDGINSSLVEEIKLEDLVEDSDIKLEIDFEKLYYNMLDAKAEWLFTLPQWDRVLSVEKRNDITKQYRRSKIVVNENKVGRNDPCPCGSGKKYKKCCGK